MAGTHLKKFFQTADTVSVLLGSEDNSIFTKILRVIAMLTVVSLLVTVILVSAFLSVGAKQQEIMNNAEEIFSLYQNSKGLDLVGELKLVNPDTVGWIYAPETKINTAVFQTNNDSFYINHNQQEEKSRYGAVFLSSNDNLEVSSGDKNLVIYGNNMHDGLMFGSLKKYRSLNFYKQNAGFYFYHAKGYDAYAICSVMLLDSEDNEGYNVTKSYFINDEEFDSWYGEAKSRSIINTGISASCQDSFITLITTAPDFEGARLAVLAKRIDNTDISSIVTTNAVGNGKIKYPKAWYNERGLKYPY